ncbi:hypothetical protein Tco_1316676 [Tanacetum coccineum]
MDSVKPKVLTPGMYAIDVEPIPPRNRNNREVHLDYLKHRKDSVETLREIVEEARIEKPLDSSLTSACLYTKQSQESLEYVIGTFPKDFNKRDKKIATTPLIRKKQVTSKEPCRTDRPLVFGFRLLKTYYGESLTAQEFYEKCDLQGLLCGRTRIQSLFVEQFCDSDLEVAFKKHSCYVRDTNGVELLKGSRGSNLYTISVEDVMKSSPIYLLSKASKNKSWLWHH